MVRGRLTAINGRSVSSTDYPDDRAKRLVDREFNLSWARALRADNLLVAGRWWSEAASGLREFSVEEGIADTLGIRLHDRLTYEVGGQVLEGTVTSLRKVEWDSFRVNFFVLSPPGMLDPYPASYVTSFHLAQERAGLMDQLVKRFPNFLVIDVAAVLAQIQRMMDQVVKAVEFVFLFGLLAGVIVLVAAINASQDERVLDAAILRTLGASSAQMRSAQSAEFVAIGALAGLLAALGASVLGFVLATRVLAVSYTFSPMVWVAGLATGTAGVLAAGLISTRAVRRAAPMEIFRRAA
jgi:putative ABC transport system permease protein